MKKKNIIIVSPGFPSSESESETLAPVQMFLKALLKINKEYTFTLIALQYPFKESEYHWNGIKVYSMNGSNGKYLKKIITWHKAHRKFLQLKNQFEIKGILSLWLNECFIIGERMAKSAHCKHFNWVLGQDANSSNRYLKFIRPKNKQLVAISSHIQQKLESRFKKEVLMIPGGFYTDQQYDSISNKTIDFLSVGSLIPLKNQMAFLQMLKKLHDKGIKFNACVIGSGKNENKLKLFAKENLPINQIEFTGLIPHEEVIRKMLQSRCLVHTSLYEGNSTVISEAAYCGAWVICQKNHFTGNHPNIIYYNDLKNLAMEAEKVIRNDKPGVFGIQEPDMLQSATRFLELFQ